MSFPAKPTFVIKTLGCKVNQYEAELMRENLEKGGFLEKTGRTAADYYIINSCTVTSKADKDTRNLVRRFRRLNPDAKIVVAGCYAELEKDRNALAQLPGVTHLVRNKEKAEIAAILNPQSKILNSKCEITDFKNRDRAFVKIQDGCDHKCSYCKVSLVRGPSRSRCAEEIIEEVRHFIEKGFREIVLTGVCLGAWGRGLGIKMDLADLVDKISRINGSFRIRLSSVEPLYVTGRLINTLRDNQKVCKHLHMPLQSGDNRILKSMRRPYTAQRFWQIVKKARRGVPDIAITTDVLVGFPGEDETGFRNTVKFLNEMKPSRMHVFSYSRRDGTPAAKFKHIPKKPQVRERVRFLAGLNRDFSMDFAAGFIGRNQDVLIETERDRFTNLLCGYTDKYVRILVDGPDSIKNGLISVKVAYIDREKNTVFAHLPKRTCRPPRSTGRLP